MFAATFFSLQRTIQTTESPFGSEESVWPRSTPEEQGIDSELLVIMLEQIRDDTLQVHSVLILRNESLVLEAYVHPYERETLHDVKSVSKSVISALVGIAFRDSILTSLDQPVQEFFPQYASFSDNSLKQGITLGHLLTMTSGLDLDENGPAMNEISSHDDWIEATFERSMRSSPGEAFQYCTFLTLAMTRILTEASGGDLLDFSDTLLFAPLGFSEVHWGTDPQGYRFGGDQLWLRPIDMVKFGSLFLHHGRWHDRQVVPESWVTASTVNRFADFDEDGYNGYGYWWWLPGDGSYRARGAFGQIISIYPNENMVVVFTGASNEDWERLTHEYLLPAVSEESQLPPNAQAVSRLRQLTHELSNPEPRALDRSPAIATEISGRPFALEQNNLEFSELTFWFEEAGLGRLSITYGEGSLDPAIGMDNVFRMTDGVSWGMRTDGNTFALRGRWVSDNQLELNIHEVGEPFYFDIELTFAENRVEGTFIWQPVGWRTPIVGFRK
jgi:CubicO group peptidase (beta-lactamase class C family)